VVVETGIDPRFFLSEDPLEQAVASQVIQVLEERERARQEEQTREELKTKLRG
jgi:hypothetical protein